MSWMTITLDPMSAALPYDRYVVKYSTHHRAEQTVEVDRQTADLLEAAKEAGAHERVQKIRKLLELSW